MRGQYTNYLTLNDYLTTIRSDQLVNQLLDYIEDGGELELNSAESYAIAEVYSKLGTYFYLDFEFRDLKKFLYERKYFAGDRCIIDFPLWVAASSSESESLDQISYVIGDCRLYNGGTGYVNGVYTGNYRDGSIWTGYCCKQPNSDTTFKSANWTAIGLQYDIYNVPYPYPIFQLMPSAQIGISVPGLYQAGVDNVCWVKRLYSCISDSNIPSHHYAEQFNSTKDVPPPNVFPNQRYTFPNQSTYPNFLSESASNGFTSGNQQWKDNGEFYFKEILPFQTNWNNPELNEGVDAWSDQYRKVWNTGDNRDPIMKEIVIAIALAHLNLRNSFLLKERAIKRDWAYKKLDLIKKGEDTTLIPIIQPEQVGNISHGGDVKKINQF